MNNKIEHEAFCVAEEILDAAGVPRDQQSESKEKVKNRLVGFAKAILEHAAQLT